MRASPNTHLQSRQLYVYIDSNTFILTINGKYIRTILFSNVMEGGEDCKIICNAR